MDTQVFVESVAIAVSLLPVQERPVTVAFVGFRVIQAIVDCQAIAASAVFQATLASAVFQVTAGSVDSAGTQDFAGILGIRGTADCQGILVTRDSVDTRDFPLTAVFQASQLLIFSSTTHTMEDSKL